MHDSIVTEEFARFFESLDEADAEEVASALDVLVEAGGALGPGRVSRLLLWFDGTRAPGAPAVETELAVEALSRVSTGLDFRQDVLRCLESEAFSARLARLDSPTAARALALVERIRFLIQGTRTYVVLARGGAAEGGSHARLERDFSELLSLAGLDPSTPPGSEPGVWELGVKTPSGPVRLLYGVDEPRRRVVVLLGERLDRAYYGDSVRFAERRYRRYRREAAQSTERA
jgi:hypothetical protein